MKTFFILALSMFSSTLGMGVVAPLLPLYAKDMGATGIWLGLIMAAYSISNSIGTPIAGSISDRRGRKTFLVIGLLAYSVISLGYIWAGSPGQLVIVRLCQGVAGAATFPVAMAYIGDLSPEGEEGRWQGWANAAFFAGFGLGPLMGGVLTEYFGLKATFYTMGGLNLFAFTVALFLLPESRRRPTSEEFNRSFKEISDSNMIRGLFSFQLVQALGRGGIFAFLPIFADSINLSTSLIGVLLTVNFSSWILITPVGGMIADRLNRRTITIVGNLLFAMVLVAIPVTNNFGQLLTILLIQGIFGALVMPAASALTVAEGRKFGMGSTMSLFFLAMSLGTAVGPILSGKLYDSVNIESVFYFAAIMGGIGTALFAWFTRQYRRELPVSARHQP